MARDVNNPSDPSQHNDRLPPVIDPSFHLPRPPFWLVAGLIVFVVASWIPLVFFALERVRLTERPPIEIFQGMHDQPRFNAQDVNPLFQDNRAMRPPVPGTVARGELREDDHYYRGYRLVQNGEGEWEPEFFTGLPPQVEVTLGLMQRGQERFDIYCFPCHGYDGGGNGPINQRAMRLQGAGPAISMGTSWVPASDLHEERLGEGYEDGRLFSVISHGIRNMTGYRQQIDVEDRWAIVAYMRALQYSQNVPAADLTPAQREALGQTQPQAQASPPSAAQAQ